MKYGGQLILTACLSLYLTGCAVTSPTPAPVTDLKTGHKSAAKGSYRGSYYTVNKGDSLYYIAYITDKDVNELIRYNYLTSPYVIHPGQKINLWNPAYVSPRHGKTPLRVKDSQGLTNHSLKKSKSEASASKSKNKPDQVNKQTAKSIESSKSKRYGESASKENVNKNATKSKKANSKIAHWLWLTKGRLVRNFSSGNQGNKGIDITGRRGQNIESAAAGTVVYSGNALRGYGNLVIIKHNDNYLSAYAHNERLLVKEGQSVKAGQKIATMGSSGTNSVRLHFEIRYQGKSVNPVHYLP